MSPDAMPPQSLVGYTVGPPEDPDRWRIVDDFARRKPTGEAVVYQAVRDGGSGEEIALKRHRMTALEVEVRKTKLFERVDRLKALPPHAALVRTLDAFIGPAPHPRGKASPSESCFYGTMEWLPGSTYEDRVERLGPHLSPLLPIANGLDVVHAHGLRHLDVKPSNVRVLGSNPQRPAVLIDFGISRAIDEDMSRLLGTKGFADPAEQLGRPDEHWIGYADLFGFCGCIFFGVLSRMPADPDPLSPEQFEAALKRALPAETARAIAEQRVAYRSDRPSVSSIAQWFSSLDFGDFSPIPAERVAASFSPVAQAEVVDLDAETLPSMKPDPPSDPPPELSPQPATPDQRGQSSHPDEPEQALKEIVNGVDLRAPTEAMVESTSIDARASGGSAPTERLDRSSSVQLPRSTAWVVRFLESNLTFAVSIIVAVMVGIFVGSLLGVASGWALLVVVGLIVVGFGSWWFAR